MRPSPLSLLAAIVLLPAVALATAGDYKAPATPGKTLAADLAVVKAQPGKAYLAAHPRLVTSPGELADLKARAARHPKLWKAVVGQAKSLAGFNPTSQQISEGFKYWRAEWIFSGALAYHITGEKTYFDSTVKQMEAYCAANPWGVKYNSNHDLEASWYLYYISNAYDLLYNDLPADVRAAVAKALVEHAEAIYRAKSAYKKFTYDQNHMYIPVTALATASLALADDYPAETDKWLTFAVAVMNRCRYVLGADGYYYEGTGYWSYAMHWHVRYADMMQRAFGDSENFFDLPALKDNNFFARYMYLPDTPFAFDIGDGFSGPADRPAERSGAWAAMLYRIGRADDNGDFAVMADRLREGNSDDPAMSFLWYWQPDKPVKFWDAPTYHYFKDHGVVCWRSSWDDDAACYMFKAGPPQGHAAAAKLKQLDDWSMNSGHVHPDIGAFWIYAKGRPLAMDTGYLGEKFTDDHSTLLVDGKGMGADGSYWAYRGWPYETFDKVRILTCELNENYGYVAADIGAAWQTSETGALRMIRHVVMTEEYMLVVDELSGEKPHTWSFLINTEYDDYLTETSMTGWGHYVQATGPEACLRAYPIVGGGDESYGPNEVRYGRGPGNAKTVTTGGQIRFKSGPPNTERRFVVLLVPATPMDVPPQTKLLRSDADAVELKYNYTMVGVDLKQRKAYFDPPK